MPMSCRMAEGESPGQDGWTRVLKELPVASCALSWQQILPLSVTVRKSLVSQLIIPSMPEEMLSLLLGARLHEVITAIAMTNDGHQTMQSEKVVHPGQVTDRLTIWSKSGRSLYCYR